MKIKKIISLLLCAVLLLMQIPFSGAAQHPFADVSDDAWYADAVAYVYKNGYMNGTGETAFAPDSELQRCMLVTSLWRLAGKPESGESAFADVPADAYYEQAVAWASANDVVGGYGGGKFGPLDPVTREQLASVIYRYAINYMDWNLGDIREDISGYAGFDKLSSWASEAMSWVVQENLFPMRNSSDLAPTADATRAEVAACLAALDEIAAEIEFAKNHTHNYTAKTVSLGNGMHGKVCECGDAINVSSCSYVKNKKLPKSNGREYTYSCSVCGKRTSTILEIHHKETLLLWVKDFAKQVRAYDGKTVMLMTDIDLTGEIWSPIDFNRDNYKTLTFDGNGHTIKQMTIDGDALDGMAFLGFFRSVQPNAHLTVKNLIFENPCIGDNRAGVVVGENRGELTLENITVKNGVVYAIGATSSGDLVGSNIGTVSVTGCITDGFRLDYAKSGPPSFSLGKITLSSNTLSNVSMRFNSIVTANNFYGYPSTLANVVIQPGVSYSVAAEKRIVFDAEAAMKDYPYKQNDIVYDTQLDIAEGSYTFTGIDFSTVDSYFERSGPIVIAGDGTKVVFENCTFEVADAAAIECAVGASVICKSCIFLLHGETAAAVVGDVVMEGCTVEKIS